MAITPDGLPAWVRQSDHTTYGGHVDKVNWHNQPLTNPRTDVGAEAFARLVADMEAVVRTAPFVVLRVTCNDTTPAAPTIQLVNQMTGIRESSYEGDAAPSGMPSGARNGDGDITLTWSSSYNDPYSVSGTVKIIAATADAEGASARICTTVITDTTVRARVFDAAGSASQDDTMIVTAYTGP